MNVNTNNKIGILGGTFNPIHIGHLLLAQNSLEFCDLSKVLIMPSGCSYLKDQSLILPKKDRINMVKLAIEDNPQFELSTIETDRDGNTYTYETLLQLTEENPNNLYYFIIGADTLFSIETWKNPQIIFDNAKIIVAPRDIEGIDKLNIQAKKLQSKFNVDIIILDTPCFNISSTQIRNNLKLGKSLKYYIPDKVLQYINNNNLYD